MASENVFLRAAAIAALSVACSHREGAAGGSADSLCGGVLEPLGARTRTPEAEPARPNVELPTRADGVAVVRDRSSRMGVAFAVLGARPSPATGVGASRAFPGGGPDESDVLFQATESGVEDFVRFGTRPAAPETRYRVDVESAAGLRLVENVLELLDATGTPRLRMAAPTIADARGTHAADVTLEGCAADHDPRGPWGRPVVPPGARECAVVVSWGAASVSYPAVLDPKWTAAKGTMVEARRAHTATLLADGTVLLVGGESGAAAATVHSKTAELFDPVTETFAATGSMTAGRSFHAAALLSTNDVLVVGGDGGSALASAEIFVVATHKFRAAGGLGVARKRATLGPSGAGSLVIAGGEDTAGVGLDTAETFAEGTELWTTTGRLGGKRLGHSMAALPTGQALVIGGATAATLGDLASTERLVAGSWSPAATLAGPRRSFGAVALSSGNLLAAGGYQASTATTLATAELYDTGIAAWAKVGALVAARTEHRLTALPNGSAIVTGGVTRDAKGQVSTYLKSAELFDPTLKTFSALPDMTGARFAHTATVLADGRVLVAGGAAAAGALATAEILTLDVDGTACTGAATCASGFCADGVCCKTVCDAACFACALASTGKPSGTCAAVTASKDPRGDCKDDGAPACTKDGLCDGKGACEAYPGSACTPKPCTDGADCTSGFCADAVCCNQACDGPCMACTAAKKGAGGDGACGPVKTATDPDADCGNLGTGVCAANGTCDGKGACRVPTEGKACAPAKCADPETAAAAALCGASGDCTPVTTGCVPFKCDAATALCKTTCAADSDCAAGAHCNGGQCARSPDGTPCKVSTDCTSTECVDGVCCDKACDGQCEACDVTGTEGTCAPVSDAPHGARAPCSGTDPCQGYCNGVVPNQCVYPVKDTTCGTTTTCTADVEVRDRCNGFGDCVSTPTPCAPFACGTDACNTKCKTDDDCSSGATCRAGSCELGASTGCADGGPGVDAGSCARPQAKAADSGGCGCRASGGPGTPAPLEAALAGLALMVLRRSRRRRGI